MSIYIIFCVWLIFVPFIHLCITFHFSNPLYTYYPTIWIYHNLCILFCFIILKNSAMTVIVYFSSCAWVSVFQDLNIWVELLDHSKFIFSIYSIIPNCLLKWLYQFILTQQNMSIPVVSHSPYHLVLTNLNILGKRMVSLLVLGRRMSPFFIFGFLLVMCLLKPLPAFSPGYLVCSYLFLGVFYIFWILVS